MFGLFLLQPDASLAQRLTAFVMRVIGAMGEQVNRVPPLPGTVRMPQAVYDRILAWLQARKLVLAATIARIEAGKMREPRGYAPRREAEGMAARPVVSRDDRIPNVFGWLPRWAPEVRWGAHDMMALLERAEMQALVLAAPGPMVRAWAPLLFALGWHKPVWFPKLPKRARRSGRRMKNPLPPCGGGLGWGVDAAGSRGESSLDGSRGFTPPSTPSHKGRGLLTPPPLVPPAQPVLPVAVPRPEPAAWTGRGPGPCATLAQYRSPFQPGGDDNPRAPPVPDALPERPKPRISKLRWTKGG
jgi:hypothetical protein